VSFINDLPDVVSSKLYMFADDTKMYRGIDTVSDRQQLQSDIDNLVTWSNTWHLLFNPLKCKVMTLGHANGTSNYTMSLSDRNFTDIAKCDSEKDLGITIDNKLDFAEHIDMVSKKANRIMAVIRRSFTCIDYKCFCLLYKSLVRPHLEYGVTSWFPYKVKDISTIEKVQKRATKQVKQISHLCYSERLKRLDLPTLRYRRHRGDMIEVFKILHGIYDLEVTGGILQLSKNIATRGHSLKLATLPSRLETRKNSFAVRVVKPWNSLPEEVIMASNVKAFEARLDNFWKNQAVKFDYREHLRC